MGHNFGNGNNSECEIFKRMLTAEVLAGKLYQSITATEELRISNIKYKYESNNLKKNKIYI